MTKYHKPGWELAKKILVEASYQSLGLRNPSQHLSRSGPPGVLSPRGPTPIHVDTRSPPRPT
ncbi:hypothetical protein HanPSC8_Chr09g0376251 [Helianthus annuus]|nr:hypothetical protein HanPSC8_Chr09g0376251 [Helianthus annuus]